MPYAIRLLSGAFDDGEPRELHRQTLIIWLEALFKQNIAWLRAHPEAPSLYESNAQFRPRFRYEREPIGQEDWKDIPTVIADGHGDCEDLACWRAAELIVRHGIAARPRLTWKPQANGAMLYHITVFHPNGDIEDPSKKLGMGRNVFG
jgi:hypothetical protein